MRHPTQRPALAAALGVAALISVLMSPTWSNASGAAGAGTFSGEICGVLSASQLSAAGITEGCVQSKTQAKAVTVNSAHWGANALAAHYLSVMLTTPQINAELYYRISEEEAKRDGTPVKIGDWAYWKTDRYNGNRRKGQILFKAGAVVGVVALNNDNPAPDEMDIANALMSIAKTLAAKLE